MKVNQLRIFHAVAKLLNFTLAAKELCLTQPGVSKHIKDLEDYYGTKLFDRLGNKVILTQAGETLFVSTSQIFSLIEESKKSIDDLSGLGSGHLTLGASVTIGTYLLPDLLVKFRKEHAGVEIQVGVGRSRQIVNKVLDNQIELGFVGHFEEENRLVVQTFLKDRMVLIVSDQHPWAGRKSAVQLQELVDQPFLLSKTGAGTWRVVSKHLARGGGQLKKIIEIGTTEGVKKAVAANLGVSLVSEHVVASELSGNQLREVPMAGAEMSREFYLLYHKGRPLSQAARYFLSLLPESPQGVPCRQESFLKTFNQTGRSEWDMSWLRE